MTEETKKTEEKPEYTHYYDKHNTITGCKKSHDKFERKGTSKKVKKTRFVEEVDCQDCVDLMIAQKFIHIESEFERGAIKAKLKTRQVSDTMRKLEEAFTMGSTVLEACAHADISRDTYYRWIKEDATLTDRFDRLSMKPTLKARAAVYNDLDNSRTGMEFLKRQSRTRAEFAERVEQTGPDGQSLPQPLININFMEEQEDGSITEGENTIPPEGNES